MMRWTDGPEDRSRCQGESRIDGSMVRCWEGPIYRLTEVRVKTPSVSRVMSVCLAHARVFLGQDDIQGTLSEYGAEYLVVDRTDDGECFFVGSLVEIAEEAESEAGLSLQAEVWLRKPVTAAVRKRLDAMIRDVARVRRERHVAQEQCWSLESRMRRVQDLLIGASLELRAALSVEQARLEGLLALVKPKGDGS